MDIAGDQRNRERGPGKQTWRGPQNAINDGEGDEWRKGQQDAHIVTLHHEHGVGHRDVQAFGHDVTIAKIGKAIWSCPPYPGRHAS